MTIAVEQFEICVEIPSQVTKQWNLVSQRNSCVIFVLFCFVLDCNAVFIVKF